MYIIGILGGVASGKSLVSGYFAELGAGVLDADRAGHEVLDEGDVRRQAVEFWGEEILDRRGRIDRRRLADIVFADGGEAASEREKLEKLTHPRIRRRLLQQAEELEKSGKRAIVLDAPLLLEAGWDKLCEAFVFVEAPREQRLARATARGWSQEDVAARESSQMSLEQKRRRADWVIDNSGTPRETREQVVAVWRRMFGG